MAFKIIWSRQARDDLREIVTFIAATNPSVRATHWATSPLRGLCTNGMHSVRQILPGTAL
jgi:hypothetical protein